MTTEASKVLEAIVLAAGAARRFGGGKLLAPWDGGVLLDGALAAAFAAPVRSVILVSGDRAQAVEAAALRFASSRGEAGRLRLVHAPEHAQGMAASLRSGIAALPTDCEGAYIFLGDMPRTPHAVLTPLADQLAAGRLAAAPMFQGRRGHPALFARTLFPDLLALQGDEGARRILDRIGPGLVESPDDGVLFDVDTPADLP